MVKWSLRVRRSNVEQADVVSRSKSGDDLSISEAPGGYVRGSGCRTTPPCVGSARIAVTLPGRANGEMLCADGRCQTPLPRREWRVSRHLL